MILRSDNGSGGVTPYITLDGGDYRVYMFGTRMQIRNDGTLHWGSAANHGVLTWDTGRAIVSAKGTNNLDLKAQSGYQVVVNETQSNVDFRVKVIQMLIYYLLMQVLIELVFLVHHQMQLLMLLV